MIKILLLISAVLLSENSQACSCANVPLAEEFKSHEMVLVGTVKLISGGGNRTVKVAVEKSWKGNPGKELTFTTPSNSAACGYPFEKGKKYLIFIWKGDDGTLSANICSRTGPYDESKKFLALLDKMRSM